MSSTSAGSDGVPVAFSLLELPAMPRALCLVEDDNVTVRRRLGIADTGRDFAL